MGERVGRVGCGGGGGELRSVIGTANWQEAPDAFISKASNRITVDHTGKEIVPHFAKGKEGWFVSLIGVWGVGGRGVCGGGVVALTLRHPRK